MSTYSQLGLREHAARQRAAERAKAKATDRVSVPLSESDLTLLIDVLGPSAGVNENTRELREDLKRLRREAFGR